MLGISTSRFCEEANMEQAKVRNREILAAEARKAGLKPEDGKYTDKIQSAPHRVGLPIMVTTSWEVAT